MIKGLEKLKKETKKKFDKLPEYHINMMTAKRKSDADLVCKTFAKGIENDEFGLKRLKPETIKAKQRKGYPSPETPLLGKGGKDKRSYKNMMVIRKVKNGYTVRPSQRLHRDGRVKLVVLYKVHEYGKTIYTGRAIIRIPARPAGEKTIKMVGKKIEKKEFKGLVQKAYVWYMRTKKDTKIKELIQKYNEESKDAIIE